MEPDLDRMTDDLTALVSAPSVNPYDAPPAPGLRESEVAALLTAMMADIGLDVGRSEVAPGRPNVWGRLPGSGGGPTLMLAGHTDTVGVEGYDGDPFTAAVRGGRLYGRGSTDMKGALAAMLETARLAKGAGFSGDLLLMFVADEEHRMTGSDAAGRDGPGADFCVVGEPTRLAVATAHKGQSVFPVTVEGRSAHSSSPERGDNALIGAARLIDAVAGYDRMLQARAPHPLLGCARATPVMIEGGESHSSVPARCRVTIDRRMLPGENPAVAADEIAAMIAEAGVRASVGAPDPDTGPLDTDPDAPVTRAALTAAASVGAEGGAGPIPFPGGTDAPNFGCPAVICGPGDLAQAHTADEYIELDQLSGAARVYLDIARALLK